jgi:hypothetical protein
MAFPMTTFIALPPNPSANTLGFVHPQVERAAK